MKKFLILMTMAIALVSCQAGHLNSYNPQTGSYLTITIWGNQLTNDKISQIEQGMFSIENPNISTKEFRRKTEKWVHKNMNKKIYLFMTRTVKTSNGHLFFSHSKSCMPFIWISLIIIGVITIILEMLGITDIFLTIRKLFDKN